MTVRLVPTAFDAPIIRPSARVSTVAKMLDDEPSQIRRMVARGDLEAHREGKRGIRVFLDSVEAWQRGNRIHSKKSTGLAASAPPKPLSGATKAAHRHAVALLESMGIMQPSRQ